MANTSHIVQKRKPFANAPSFRATGRGYYNAIPNFPATAGNANLSLVNTGLKEGDRNYLIWLFCTEVSTGWTVNGTYGQSASARTFYPNNLSQSEITFSCVVANQYEYDRVVEFTIQHHNSALNTWDQDSDPNTPGKDTAAVLLNFFPYLIDTGKRNSKGQTIFREVYGGLPGAGSTSSRGSRLQVYISSIQAGHTRFVNAKAFNITFRISYDYLSKPVYLKGELNKQLRAGYMQSFGQIQRIKVPPNNSGFVDNPGATNQNTTADPSTQQQQDHFTQQVLSITVGN